MDKKIGVPRAGLVTITLVWLSIYNQSSSVSGHEGGDISVQCLYNSGYKNKLKQWCRYKDQRCYKEKKTDTSQNSSVQISDDGRGSFTVLMTGLRLTDSGWYFCSVGKQEAPVQLNVSGKTQSLIRSTQHFLIEEKIQNELKYCFIFSCVSRKFTGFCH
uniref:Ig-like domain-containing protein n=1 Tax=Cyprinus carpio TaxID=7962 RepID=A0A8C1YIH1_CYPCA